MRNIVKLSNVPVGSIILKNFEEVDYCDCYKIVKNTNKSIDDITTDVFRAPAWTAYMMNFRNSVVKIFGLKTGNKKDMNIAIHYPVGSRAVYFKVIARNENEIVMAENDMHLNFRTSVFIDRKDVITNIYVTTIVKFNNIWGRIYFFPVKPFHSLIIQALLNRLLKNTN